MQQTKRSSISSVAEPESISFSLEMDCWLTIRMEALMPTSASTTFGLVARALATNPKVLLCDEATSALDPNTTKSILQLLKEINRNLGVTVIVITHEMGVIESICDRVAIIDKSHIAEVGAVSDIFSGPKSAIGRQLIMGDTIHAEFGDSRLVRITFDGRASNEPVLANLILACKVPVNIMYAATKDVNGTALGQMIIQLPGDEGEDKRVMNYLATAGIPHEEVTRNDF